MWLEIPSDITLTFYPEKVYRIIFLWQNSDNLGDLDRYQSAMKQTREQLQAKYIVGPAAGTHYHSLMEDLRSPDLVWIIEWPSSQAHNDYINSHAFKDNHHYFFSGVAAFQAYEAKVHQNPGKVDPQRHTANSSGNE